MGNPSHRFQESPRCFTMKRFINEKWPCKIEGATEKYKKPEEEPITGLTFSCRPKRKTKTWWDSLFKYVHVHVQYLPVPYLPTY